MYAILVGDDLEWLVCYNSDTKEYYNIPWDSTDYPEYFTSAEIATYLLKFQPTRVMLGRKGA